MNSKLNKIILNIWVLVLTINVYGLGSKENQQPYRKVISLNGIWQIDEGGMDKIPAKFDHEVVVPGLVDMAKPAFIEAGPKVADPSSFLQKDPRRGAFWYRRKFQINYPVLAVAQLRIGKAMYGTRVFLNGKLIGDHVPCFTPGYFDVKDALKSGENELIIRVGADRDAVSNLVESGMDGEKSRYIPGIYDNVELIMSGSPYIVNVQAVPDINKKSVTVYSWIKCSPAPVATKLHIVIRETKSRKMVGEANCQISANTTNGEQTGSITIPVRECQLWSPENPFLYELEVSSSSDNFSTRFGMRSFRFDSTTGRAMLNGKPYYMRGSNVTLFRFFEDSLRGDKPWREEWVRRLYKSFHDMHWNSLRYSLGFAPELWYRIADEEGFLIQDEYPIWYGDSDSFKPIALKAEILTIEFREWMKERWNHPCVVIWDACNETYSPETGKAIKMVRELDFSNRPWQNGWGEPIDSDDPDECHPYHFIFGPNQPFRMSDLANDPGTKAGILIAQPYEKEKMLRKNPAIINEYGGLWLNRDGSPTKLSKPVYDYLMEPSATTDERRILYAHDMAALTEFFRAHRQAAGIMQFCGLGYSRKDGNTSDDWVDIDKLTMDPYFYKYVRDAFASVGLMVDFWADELPTGKLVEFPVIVVNDLEKSWKGEIKFKLSLNETSIYEKTISVIVPGFGTNKVSFTTPVPKQAGKYEIEATLNNTPEGEVRSLRNFSVLTPEQHEARRNLALEQPVKASSVVSPTTVQNAVDGNRDSYWSSDKKKINWFSIDLGKIQSVSHIEITWESPAAKSHLIQVSNDGEVWETVYSTTTPVFISKTETIRFATKDARWVRLFITKPSEGEGYSVSEFGVFH